MTDPKEEKRKVLKSIIARRLGVKVEDVDLCDQQLDVYNDWIDGKVKKYKFKRVAIEALGR